LKIGGEIRHAPDRVADSVHHPFRLHVQEGGMGDTATARKQRLQRLIEEATVDCYDEEEQATGLFTMIEERLELPFKTTVLGGTVDVVGVDMTDDNRLVAVCKAGKHRQRIALGDLPLPSPPPAGAEWIAAYRLWAEGQG
jgi:hypothetical protein